MHWRRIIGWTAMLPVLIADVEFVDGVGDVQVLVLDTENATIFGRRISWRTSRTNPGSEHNYCLYSQRIIIQKIVL